MNKFVMLIWGLIIVCLWTVIIAIAYKDQDRDFINLGAELKEVGIRYLDKKNINLKTNESYKIYMSDLEEENYIKTDEKIKEYCVDSIVITKDLFKYSYKINTECKNEE